MAAAGVTPMAKYKLVFLGVRARRPRPTTSLARARGPRLVRSAASSVRSARSRAFENEVSASRADRSHSRATVDLPS
jgi:hypothetical protein|tara:strand:- start:496 stop:726 length:231 start_codon:yes stop_codon:yes gene_type:complete